MDNTPDSTAQFTIIQNTIDAASDDDFIDVQLSAAIHSGTNGSDMITDNQLTMNR